MHIEDFYFAKVLKLTSPENIAIYPPARPDALLAHRCSYRRGASIPIIAFEHLSQSAAVCGSNWHVSVVTTNSKLEH